MAIYFAESLRMITSSHSKILFVFVYIDFEVTSFFIAK